MQKVMNAYYNGPYRTDPHEEINKMLEKGWKVISMQPFSQIVSVGSGSNIATKEAGYFGMTFVLEKKE